MLVSIKLLFSFLWLYTTYQNEEKKLKYFDKISHDPIRVTYQTRENKQEILKNIFLIYIIHPKS